jgi:hypothetical protein
MYIFVMRICLHLLKAVGTVPKTIVFALFCLVLYFAAGCSSEPQVRLPETRQVNTGEVGFVHQPPLYHVLEPDSLEVPIVWNNSSPLFVRAVFSENTIAAGDTVLSGIDPFFSMETQRLEMALSIAEATGDSVAADSLGVLLLDSSVVVYITSPAAGVIENTAEPGSTVQPGDTVASVTGPPPDSVYVLVPSYDHIRWPENLEGCRVTEHGLQCTGPWPGETAALPGIRSLPQRFIYENHLDSFVITAAGDTLSVEIIGYTDTSKIIYSSFLLDSVALTSW